jgi:U3 small nucleolar RNA-associated protein 3
MWNFFTHPYTHRLPDGDKRKATYQILKNKGLIPKRKKEQRNPRVKQRNKYERAQKKLKTVKRIVAPLTGAYGGEMTGIKSNLARSVKLS